MPGTIPNFGNICLITSIPVSFPVFMSYAPMISYLSTADVSSIFPLTVSSDADAPLPDVISVTTKYPSVSNASV